MNFNEGKCFENLRQDAEFEKTSSRKVQAAALTAELGEVEKYLGNASGLSIDDVREEVFFRNGLFIPAHVDKPVFSIVSQLGFLPDADYTAIEVFNPANAKDYAKYPVISDSDAHYLDDVAKKQLYIDVEEKSFAALRDSLQKNRIVLK